MVVWGWRTVFNGCGLFLLKLGELETQRREKPDRPWRNSSFLM